MVFAHVGLHDSGKHSDLEESVLLYMVVEHFKNQDPVPVYRRFRDCGRLAPEGLQYISSWVDEKLERCFQIMETDDPKLLDEWIANWRDLTDFEVYPVITSKEAVEKISPHL
jgi:hypothetical protein